ncbi:hypothetical protein BOX37_09310 [Nocardia mangyaensis]|uniref:Integral membrane protein n=1 Tax=Nocardia mangyaensis TaxID=2213200 RepID=A0A1J0VQ38_9NOCA|nr:hypothetical protein [Nocardia mangyaensis]APE34129.1 hypothetical protein BOX37_09310 [Nocardia mangyaensis]
MTAATAPSRLSALLASGENLLRVSLRLDAVVTGANGLAYLVLAQPLERLLGLDATIGLAIGAFLTAYGLAVALVGRPATINRTAVAAVAIGNLAWVLASLVAVATGILGLTTVGSVWAVLQAITVGGFAALQYLGLRRTR